MKKDLTIPKITIIGAGKMAYNLVHALARKNIMPLAIINRTLEPAQTLANAHRISGFSNKLEDIPEESNLIIIAVTDDAISSVAQKIFPHVPKGCVLTHTSGVTPIRTLDRFERYGLFYPLASFNQSVLTNFDTIPIITDGNNTGVRQFLSIIAHRLSQYVYHLTDEQRPYLHLAAVFANNFTNALLGAAFQLLETHKIEKKILYPIIEQTYNRALTSDPIKIQTGPAVRGDNHTIEKHLQLLNDLKPDILSSLYITLTQLIIEQKENATKGNNNNDGNYI